jgi:uncharacterized protein DUF87
MRAVPEPSPFDDDKLHGAKAVLVKVLPDEQGRFEFEIWAQYTRAGLNQMQVGDLVAVENYTPPSGIARTYSILALAEVLPVHFAAQGTDAYPGHVFEAMRSIKDDWEKQDEKALHATTTILSRAVSTGLQFPYDPRSQGLPDSGEEKNLPMTGAEVRPLSRQMVDAIVNHELGNQPDSPFSHRKFPDLNVKLHVEAFLTTHFGIFGFTGVGKSNLVAALTAALTETDSAVGANVVLIDPNDEYLALLIDRFVSRPNDMLYIHVGPDSLPGPVTEVLGNPGPPAPAAVQQLLGQMKVPPGLQNPGGRAIIEGGLANVIPRTRIALPELDLADLIWNEIRTQTDTRTGPAVKEALTEAAEAWTETLHGVPVTATSLHDAVRILNDPNDPVRAPVRNRLGGTQSQLGTALGAVGRAERALDRLAGRLQAVPAAAIVPIPELIELLNQPGTGRIVIVTGRRDSDLKEFSRVLGNELYEARRTVGQRNPFTTFVFDEADLFIGTEDNDEVSSGIRELCVTLARRGRKFGLGLGIATQRAAYLDTQIMANLHTYLVSKLPRQADRQRVAEAFGVGEEQLAPTFTFRPGNWLILSHDATGLKGVPIPTTAADAVDRIRRAAPARP